MESLRHVENYLKKIISNFIIGKMQLSIKNRFRSRYRHPPNLGSNRGQFSPLRVTSHQGQSLYCLMDSYLTAQAVFSHLPLHLHGYGLNFIFLNRYHESSIAWRYNRIEFSHAMQWSFCDDVQLLEIH